MLELVKINIGWLKDFLGVIFTLVATIIAILTYIRAKDTILQPIRSEVIKRQAEIFVNILDFLNSYKVFGNDIDLGFDYYNIVHINFLNTLNDHGFSISKEEEDYLYSTFESSTFNLLNNNKLRTIPLFYSKDEENQKNIELRKKDKLQKRELASKGIIQIDILCKTKEHNIFISKLYDFATNPFIPSNIQNIFNKVMEDAEKNINIHLVNSLKEIMLVYYKKHSESKSELLVEPSFINNLFQNKRIEHVADFNILRDEVRKYLKIDKMP